MGDPKHSALYVIATPLGNRHDLTFRAKETLEKLNLFFAEDTREFRKLLELYEVPPAGKTVHSYAKHNLKEAADKALEYLAEGRQVGLVSDRGTPAISDPGAQLVRQARAAGYQIVPVPGPSSVTTALSVSGFEADKFVFLGFLSPKTSERKESLEEAAKLGLPIAIFESPHRVRATLEELKAILPGSEIFVAREMTKMFETFTLARAEEMDPAQIPDVGEFVLVVKPVSMKPGGEEWEKEIDLRLATDKAWSKEIASRYDISASDAYNALQKKKKENS